ncbi:sugar phosphate isomerase/epimerase [bacterium]|nr:sugar phosphate isomerase/epimerase [bacterium]
MNYSFMSFSTPAMTLAEMLAAAKQYGYDGIEPRLAAQHQHGIELDTTPTERQAVRQQAADAGIELCCLATSCRYADPQTSAQTVQDTRRLIDLAAEVGSPRLRVFGGAFPDDVSRQEAISRVSDCLRPVAEHARACGVTICLETHDAWTNPEHVAAVMLRVNHPGVGVNWDHWHPVRQSGWSVDKSFAVLRRWIQHVHFHDGLARHDQFAQRAIGDGDLEVGLVVRLLREAGYRGYLSGEWINWEPAEVHLPREIAAVKKLEQAAG